MKRVLFFLLALVLTLSLAACGGSSMSSGEAEKNIKNALGNYKELPMDMEQIKSSLGENVLEQSSQQEGSKDSTHIALGSGVTVYKSVVDKETTTPTGKPYRFVISVMHFGGAEAKKDNVYKLHFIGANIQVDVEAEDKAGVLQELKGQLTGEDAALMTDLLDGKQIYAAVGSALWEMYAQVNTNVEITYNKALGTLLIRKDYGYDEVFDQYSYEILDLKGRVQKCVYYKQDECGKSWITENYEYTYLDDGTVKVYDTNYYDYSEQIWNQSVRLEYSNTNRRTLWRKSYLDDGKPETEMYFDEAGNQVNMEYFNDGTLYRKRITKGVQYDGDYGEDIYEEEYATPGILGKRYSLDGTIVTNEMYYFNGNLMSKEVRDLSRHFPDGAPFTIESIKGFEDGSRNVFTYYENREQKTMKSYDAAGNLTQEVLYRENGNRESDTYFQSDGCKSVYTFHDNGVIKCCTEYNAKGEIYAVTHYDESGYPID